MIKLVLGTKKRMFGCTLFIIVLFVAQLNNLSFTRGPPLAPYYKEFSDEELINDIKNTTSKLISLFNNKVGIFLWNTQNLVNISRYGEFADLTNSDESLQKFDTQQWLNGLAQDITMQYLFLENYIQKAFAISNYETEEEMFFNREWILMTQKIISWLFYNIAVNNELIIILNYLSPSNDGFDSYWDTLIRPKYNELIGEKIALLPDTFILGSRILQTINFMSYFSYYERNSIELLLGKINKWWSTINQYALFDPNFAIAGFDSSYITTTYSKWIGWEDMFSLARNNSLTPLNIFDIENIHFQNIIFISPQIADLYLTYIEKTSVPTLLHWEEKANHNYSIKDQVLSNVFHKIIDEYTNHITRVEDKIVYLINPDEDRSWIALETRYSGYSYVWLEYFVDAQDSDYDLNQYLYESFPLKRINMRTFQGAGDMKGMMDVYRVLSHGFLYDSFIQHPEEKAFLIIDEILNTKREDNSFLYSPYFGTSLDESIITNSLINDATLVQPSILPEGLNRFTGTMTVMKFLLDAHEDLKSIGSYTSKEKIQDFNDFKVKLENTLIMVGQKILSSINLNTMGIPKQAIIGKGLINFGTAHLYYIETIILSIDLENVNFSFNELPKWLINCNEDTLEAQTYVYQWDYFQIIKDLFLITEDIDFINPLFESLLLFKQDYSYNRQYQLTSICEGKDAIVRYFFKENFIIDSVKLSDNTNFFGNSIPYLYRDEIAPVTDIFASETPIKLTAQILSILPQLFETIIENPINQIVLVGFLTGIIITIAVCYIKRPKNQ